MTTDGENKNAGEQNGLWKLTDDERAKEEVSFLLPKSVCAVHSSALAYYDLCKNVSKADTQIRRVSGISSFFHASAVRIGELEKYEIAMLGAYKILRGQVDGIYSRFDRCGSHPGGQLWCFVEGCPILSNVLHRYDS